MTAATGHSPAVAPDGEATVAGGEDEPHVPPATTPAVLRRRRRTPARRDDEQRSALSALERRSPRVRIALGLLHAVIFCGLVVGGLGPLLWLVKASVATTQDTLREPLALWPSGLDLENLSTAWNEAEISKYFVNTVWLAAGSWFVQVFVATTGGYVLAILRPRYARVVTAMVLATLFVPPVVLLVPLFVTVLDLPLVDWSLLNSYWGVWLPAGASAFNVILMKRFFDNLPTEVIEAARVDGAGPFRLLWSIVLPMSKPILGVVSVFAVLNAWKDFLWPLLVLPDPGRQPLSVRLPTIRDTVELDVFLAALLISTLIPVLLFLVFQRLFLRGAGIEGAVKG